MLTKACAHSWPCLCAYSDGDGDLDAVRAFTSLTMPDAPGYGNEYGHNYLNWEWGQRPINSNRIYFNMGLNQFSECIDCGITTDRYGKGLLFHGSPTVAVNLGDL